MRRRQYEDWSAAVLGRSAKVAAEDWANARLSFSAGESPVGGSKGWLAHTENGIDQPCITLLSSAAVYFDIRPQTMYSGPTLLVRPLADITRCEVVRNDVGGTRLGIALPSAEPPIVIVDLPRGREGESFGNLVVNAWRESQIEAATASHDEPPDSWDMPTTFYEFSRRLDEAGVPYAIDFGCLPQLSKLISEADPSGDTPEARVLRRGAARDYEVAPAKVVQLLLAYYRDQRDPDSAIEALMLALRFAVIWPEYLVATGQHPRLMLRPDAVD